MGKLIFVRGKDIFIFRGDELGCGSDTPNSTSTTVEFTWASTSQILRWYTRRRRSSANALGADSKSVFPDRLHWTVLLNHNSNFSDPILSVSFFLITDRTNCSSLVTRLFILYTSKAKVCCNHRSYNPRAQYCDAARFLDWGFFICMYSIWTNNSRCEAE